MHPESSTANPADAANARPRRIVLTGGPGGGKTAVFEAVRARLGERLTFVPEAATIVFGGGFPRLGTIDGTKAAQLAIYRVQEQLEAAFEAAATSGFTLLDRSLVDATVYWPGDPREMLDRLGVSYGELFARYDLVLHLEVPPAGLGYDRSNPIRVESAAEAEAIDRRITAAWSGHPRVVTIPCAPRFEDKLAHCLEQLVRVVPEASRAG